MEENHTSLEILMSFVDAFHKKKTATVVQGVFKEKASRAQNGLYKTSDRVTKAHLPYLQKFQEILLATMQAESGIGIASCQVGVPLQFFLIEVSNPDENARYSELEEVPFQAFINPRIIRASKDKKSFWHSCLSARGQKMGKVATYSWVECEAFDLELNPFTCRLDGMASIIFQHEFRHLLGKLYLDQTQIVLSSDAFNRQVEDGSVSVCEDCGDEVPHLLSDYKVGSSIEEYKRGVRC